MKVNVKLTQREESEVETRSPDKRRGNLEDRAKDSYFFLSLGQHVGSWMEGQQTLLLDFAEDFQ